jgi:hypothetical protein
MKPPIDRPGTGSCAMDWTLPRNGPLSHPDPSGGTRPLGGGEQLSEWLQRSPRAWSKRGTGRVKAILQEYELVYVSSRAVNCSKISLRSGLVTREARQCPRYKFRVLRQLRVGDSLRQPGQLVNEAAEWPNVRNYLSLQWIEQIPVTDDADPDGVEYPPVSPQSRLAQVLEPERERPPEIVASARKQSKASKAVRCRNWGLLGLVWVGWWAELVLLG